MTSRRYGRLFFVVSILTLSLILSIRFSFVQSEQPPSLPDLQNVPPQAKLSHPACPNCFTYACPDCYNVMEEVPGTGLTIARLIPNPAPLEPDEQRLEFDPETGLPIWYIGRQPYVGPTDEQPYSAEYPVPLIQLKRIHVQVQNEVFSIPGVHAFGIGGKGFVVYLEPKQSANKVLVPEDLEGVPVEVQTVEPVTLLSHDLTRFTPVPTGVSISGTTTQGTLGPHVVRLEGGGVIRIHSLTAAHVLKVLDAPVSIGTPVYQPSLASPNARQWGTLLRSFQLIPCDTVADPFCFRAGAPVNLTWQNPDVAMIQNITGPDQPVGNPPVYHTSPPGSDEPIRRLQYGTGNTWVNGPSGIVVSPSFGAEAKMWGASTSGGHAPKGNIGPLLTFRASGPGAGGTRQYLMQYLCEVNLERSPAPGDSGALMAGNGVGNRHVYGLTVAASGRRAYHVPAGDIQTAFVNLSFPIDHYWGTQSGRADIWYPANTQCDGSC
jgi:hypothetical protein